MGTQTQDKKATFKQNKSKEQFVGGPAVVLDVVLLDVVTSCIRRCSSYLK